jgi:integrative and conjugative element protein (TIGR02256 family)
LLRGEARGFLGAALHSQDFEVVGIGFDDSGEKSPRDIVIVETQNESVLGVNSFGIHRRERLAVVFGSDDSKGPEVRTLRCDFPRSVPHLNHVPDEEPASLCLYFEPWSSARRSWTPQRFLKRILGWLAATSTGTLHRPDQPVETLYLSNAVEVVLSTKFDAGTDGSGAVLILRQCVPSDPNNRVFRAEVIPGANAASLGGAEFFPLLVEIDPVVQGAAEKAPTDLGQLNDQVESRCVAFFDCMKDRITRNTPETGATDVPGSKCLLILPIQIKREDGGVVEGRQIKGYIVLATLGDLGEACGVLYKTGGKYHRFTILGADTEPKTTGWRGIKIVPVDIKFAPTKEVAWNSSGLTREDSEFKGVLAGVGALGGTLGELWAKAAWGSWTIVDSDILKAHNIPRHLGKDRHIGFPKVQVVKEAMESNYEPGYFAVQAFDGNVTESKHPDLIQALHSGNLLVDATTSVEVPRDLSADNEVPRCASVFLTPSGRGAVLILEGADRATRLDALEAQYYRSIINSEWGEKFLTDPKGVLWVGAGCRDVSSVIPNDLVHLHAALLARQIRIQSKQLGPKVGIWITNDESGDTSSEWPQVYSVIKEAVGSWAIVWDEGTRAKLNNIRNEQLPQETGGVIVGFIDQVTSTIYVVDVLPAPPDSLGTEDGFIRGIENLQAQLDEIGRRTARVVHYIGEWHSHPPFSRATPSGLDKILLKTLADDLADDGQPALMMIVGCNGVHHSLYGVGGPLCETLTER